jgi:glutathione S-transferase
MITLSTPNGKKVQIMLEALKETYGTECEVIRSLRNDEETLMTDQSLSPCLMFRTNNQKKDWFLRLNGMNVSP